MRLIDADALEKEGWSLHRTIRVDKNTDEYQTKPLKQIPTIEPERKTGRWINGKCDQCGGHAPYWAMASTYYESDFCQHCGSPMEVEHEKDTDTI